MTQYGYVTCRHCGVNVAMSVIQADMHECSPEVLVAYQTRMLEHLETDIETYKGTPEGQSTLKLVDFQHWLKEHERSGE